MGQQLNLEQAQFAQESIQDTINTVNSMQQAYDIQKRQMKQINVGKVEAMMDNFADLQMDQEEINEVMSRNYALEGMDETELEDELNELDNEIFEDNLTGNSMSVPSYIPQQSYTREEAKLNDPEELPSVPN